eukprot:6465834-Amphidinium_carterae.1
MARLLPRQSSYRDHATQTCANLFTSPAFGSRKSTCKGHIAALSLDSDQPKLPLHTFPKQC